MGIFCFFKSSQENKKNEDTFVLTLIDDKEEIPKEITLKIHVCGINKDDPRISNIYTSTINNVKDKCKGDFECHQSLYYWIIKLYSKELNEDTFNEICEEIRRDRDTQAINIKQNTILYFEDDPKDSEQKNLLIQKIQDLGFVYRPRIIFITKQKYSFNMIDNRYITNIIWNDNSEEGRYKFIQLITSTIWNIDCYYNERLDEKIILELDESNVILKKLKDNINDYSFNILLSGLSRAGKSSFINLMTGKLSALESNDKESVTSKITDYFIYPPKIESDKNNHLCSIKLIDSPGIVLNFMDQCQNQKTVINNIKEAINDNSINKIDIVLFFFKEGDSLETSIEVLKMLNDNNCTVLFIINHSTEDEESGQREISATISFLNQNDCLNINKKENFIPTNFKKSKRMDFFGMKEIWKRIYDIIDKENPSFNEDNEQLIKDLSNDVFGISEEMNKDKKIADFKKIISKNNIFKKINEKNIIEKCNNMVEKLCNNINYLLSVNGKYNNNDDEKYKYLAILIIEIGKRFGFQNKIIENKFEALIRFLWDFNLEEKKKLNKAKLKKEKEKEKKAKKKDKGKAKKTKEKEKEIDINEIKETNIREEFDTPILKKNSLRNEENKIAKSIKNYEKNDEKIFKKIYNGLLNNKDDIKDIMSKPNYLEIFSNGCMSFYKEELKKEEFISFYYKYYQIYKNCFKYINDLSKKESWENYEPEYINKGNDSDDSDDFRSDNNINEDIKIESNNENKNNINENKNSINENTIKEDDKKVNDNNDNYFIKIENENENENENKNKDKNDINKKEEYYCETTEPEYE
jgi:hypothetical protein